MWRRVNWESDFKHAASSPALTHSGVPPALAVCAALGAGHKQQQQKQPAGQGGYKPWLLMVQYFGEKQPCMTACCDMSDFLHTHYIITTV